MPTRADSMVALTARTASSVGPCALRALARLNKWVTNPIVRQWAPHTRYLAVIEHTGRKSGKTFRTPVMAFVKGGKLSVVLNYGAESDWVRNVQAAGSAEVVHRGKRYHLTNPRVMPVDSPELPLAVRVVRMSGRSALQGTMNRH